MDDGIAHPEPGLAGRLVAVDVDFAHGGVHVVVACPVPVVDHLIPERGLAVGQGGVESGEPQGPLRRDAGLAPGLLALAGPAVLRVEEGDGPHLELVRPGQGDAGLPGRGLGLKRLFVRGGLQQQGGVQARLHDAAPVQLEHPARAVALRAGEGDPGPGRGVPDEEARRVGGDVRPGEDQRQLGLAAFAPAVGGDLHDRLREGFCGVLGLQALEELGVRARQVAHAHHGDRQVRPDEDPVPVGVHRVLTNLHSRELVGHELDALLAELHQRVVAHGERDLVHGLHRGVADGEARVPLVEEEPGGRRALDEADPATGGGRQDQVRAAVLGRVEHHAGVLLVGCQEARVPAYGARADEPPVVLQRQDGVLVAEHVEVPVDAREGELGRRLHRHRVLLHETELGAALALLRLHPEVGGDPGHLDSDVPLVGHQDPPLLDVVDPQLDGEHLADRDGAVPLALQAHLPEEADALALDALRDRVDLGRRREEEEVGRLFLVGLQDLAAHDDVLVRVVGPKVPENDLGGGDRPLHVQVRVLRVRVQLGDLPQVQVAKHVEVVLLDRVPRPCGVAAAASVAAPQSEAAEGGRSRPAAGGGWGSKGVDGEGQVLRAVPPRTWRLAPGPIPTPGGPPSPLGGPRLPPGAPGWRWWSLRGALTDVRVAVDGDVLPAVDRHPPHSAPDPARPRPQPRQRPERRPRAPRRPLPMPMLWPAPGPRPPPPLHSGRPPAGRPLGPPGPRRGPLGAPAGSGRARHRAAAPRRPPPSLRLAPLRIPPATEVAAGGGAPPCAGGPAPGPAPRPEAGCGLPPEEELPLPLPPSPRCPPPARAPPRAPPRCGLGSLQGTLRSRMSEVLKVMSKSKVAEEGGRVRPASGEGGRNARRQGRIGRRSGPGTWVSPRSRPPRAPLAP